MELHLQLPDAAKYKPCLSSSSSSFLTFDSRIILPWKSPGRAKQPFSLRFVKSEKKSLEKSKGLQREAKRDLSRILRTEAATKGIEKKANSAKSNRLWPKAVLEALDDSINNNHWESALKIFGLLRKQHWYQPRCQTYTKLLMMLAKCGQPKQASFLFEVMLSEGLKPTVDVYTSLVNAYGLSGLFDEAFHTVDDMKSVSDCRPDVVTYSTLINCCTKFHRFDLIDPLLTEMSYSGIQCSTVTYNTIINGYGKAEMFEQMEKALMDMIESGQCLPDVFTLNSIVWAYGNAGQIENMEKWYDEFQHMGIRPDIRTFNTLMRSYGKVGMFEKMVSVLEFMEKRFFSPTIVTFNIIIEMFGRNRNIKKMEYFFQKMKHRGIKPNSITYCSLVSVYGKAGLLDKVDSILRQADNSDIVLDTPFFNCVISAFGQVGNIKRMEEMFLIMKEKKCMPDKITFATMIQAYKVQGNLEAVREFEKEIFNGEKTQVPDY
ncbi:pentatricopeptide repeat-containing protein At3g53170 [Macadamia integrifolia]|uniref:pentatricopeptide repeat-containing protein At3g53170 n=1 Tax=Macadamia integrifolia TaxID=60698 RepID=UPI001C4E77E5|nr:pentatricopeptide repeat-containing protein At3g53170 [Macadamia integrifolia]XP_042504011.1 pentatricopeptide repeat-containing protein At3g53170 [Macadamia integrifolia]XP_042504017.1 pentatricopeptide repeat-containing protein At3g53170 [Macadamia integrifolia]XP_042504023.1 pentatricopeptide repeat-containing protein At3g53170 [Macadamia integrifolia]XP_042504031.1 pentatricopeptide repeat-containing protein At3g53170 [Macadamia integrifolia]